jgi:hypothetical protein
MFAKYYHLTAYFVKFISLLCSNNYLQIAIASPGWQAIQKMKLGHVVDRIGEEWIFLTVSEAVEGCLTAHKGSATEC